MTDLPPSPINITPRPTPTGTRPITAKDTFEGVLDPIGKIETAGNDLLADYWRVHFTTLTAADLDQIDGRLAGIEKAIGKIREILPLVRAKL